MTNALEIIDNSLYSIQEGSWNKTSFDYVWTEARSLATLADLQKTYHFVYQLLIAGLVRNFVAGVYDGWYVVGASLK